MARLNDEQIDGRLAELPGWERTGDAIHRQFDRGDFLGSVALVNAIAPVAEELGHHPDLEISWSKVQVTLTTHSEGGLTARDFELAARIEAAA